MHAGYCRGGGGVASKPGGGGLRMGELGRVLEGARSGLGWVARHDGVRSVPRYYALPQHVSPKTRVPVVTGPRTCCRWRVCLAGGRFCGWVAALRAFGVPCGCRCVAPLAEYRGPVLPPGGPVRHGMRGWVAGLVGTGVGAGRHGQAQNEVVSLLLAVGVHVVCGGLRLAAIRRLRLASGAGGGFGSRGGGLPGGRVQRGARGGRHVDVREELVGV